MLGNKCPFYDRCTAHKGNRFLEKNYCYSEASARNCSERPINYGNEEVRRNQQHRQSIDSDLSLFWWGVAIIAIIGIIAKIM